MKNKKSENIFLILWSSCLFLLIVVGNFGFIRGTHAWFGDGMTGDVNVQYKVQYISNYPSDVSLVNVDNSDYCITKVECVVKNNLFEVPLGYTFDGWNTTVDGTGNKYVVGTSFTIEDNMVFYAQWLLSSEEGDDENKDDNDSDIVDDGEVGETDDDNLPSGGTSDDEDSEGDTNSGNVVGSGTVTPGASSSGNQSSSGSGTGTGSGGGNSSNKPGSGDSNTSSQPGSSGNSSNNSGNNQGSSSLLEGKEDDLSSSSDGVEQDNISTNSESDNEMANEKEKKVSYVGIVVFVICLLALRLILLVIKIFKQKYSIKDLNSDE